jgi:hypothetical protein
VRPWPAAAADAAIFAVAACGGPYRPHLKAADFVRAEVAYRPAGPGDTVVHRAITDSAVIRTLVAAGNRMVPPPPPPGSRAVPDACAGPAGAPWADIRLDYRWGGSIEVRDEPCDAAVDDHHLVDTGGLLAAAGRAVGR